MPNRLDDPIALEGWFSTNSPGRPTIRAIQAEIYDEDSSSDEKAADNNRQPFAPVTPIQANRDEEELTEQELETPPHEKTMWRWHKW